MAKKETPEEFAARIKKQNAAFAKLSTRAKRIAIAKDVLDNNGTFQP